MSYSIFIKTWKDDVKWLPYTLQSIVKYGSGYDQIIIISDQSCLEEVKQITPDYCTVVGVEDWSNGYIQQQWIKLNADTWIWSDHVLFVDSDCVFHSPFSEESYTREGKPILLKTRYGDLGGAEKWKSITSEFVRFEVEYEYMRRLPWMYRTSSLTNFKNKYPRTLNHLITIRDHGFSEFNALGAFIDKYEKDQYYISDTEVWTPDYVAKQYRSWDGVTPEIQTEINNFLSGGAN